MGKITASSNPLLLRSLPIGLAFSIGVMALALWGETADADSGLTEASAVSREIPEEVLQIRVEVEANSPLTGQAQFVDTYAQEQQALQVGASEVHPRLAPSVYRAVELLRLRKVIKELLPFF
jgi:hypothetical protein